MTVLGAVDIGSNAIRLAIGSADSNGKLTILENFREPVRLGQDVFSLGDIQPETQSRAIAALKRFRDSIKKAGCKHVRVVATSAMREARNRIQFTGLVQELTGLAIEIIEGGEEARLVHLAVSHAVDLSKKRAVLIDIGGGSVEISFTRDGDVVFSDSVKMGTVRLLQMLGEKKMSPAAFGKLIRRYVEGIHRRLDLEIDDQSVDICVGTGGNVEALVDQCGGKRAKNGLGSASLRDLQEYLNKISEMSVDERVERLKLRVDRADVILPAGLVISEIMRHVGAEEILSPNVGLKDGVLWDLIPSVESDKRGAHRKQVLAFSRALGRRYHFDEQHAERVVAHALDLFDQSAREHGLGAEERVLLEIASWLHDIGAIISVSGHHKHTQYLIRQTPFVGLNRRERELVALIARYHRKSMPKDEHEEYRALAEKDRERVRKLASFLRLAEGIEQEHAGGERCRLTLRWTKEHATLSIESKGERVLERWAAANKADLFEKVFQRKLLVEKV